LVFTLTAALRFNLGAARLIQALATSVVWSLLFLYVFDASNQAVGAAEDAHNKPYRPIPAGLTTASGMRRRMAVAAALFLGISAAAGWVSVVAAAAWIIAVLTLYFAVPVRYGHIYKPLPMFVGTVAQLAGSWAIAHPLDSMGWRWILVVSALFTIALPIEDVRDMEGDRVLGRRTLALTWGAQPLRVCFIALMALWPFIAYGLLFNRSGAPEIRVWATTGVFAMLCWVTAIYTWLNRTLRGNRRAFVLYSGVHLSLIISSLALIA
jgi:4-hydroxybenzoate polyprenyltransferase